jgi:hypothetical protein
MPKIKHMKNNNNYFLMQYVEKKSLVTSNKEVDFSNFTIKTSDPNLHRW